MQLRGRPQAAEEGEFDSEGGCRPPVRASCACPLDEKPNAAMRSPNWRLPERLDFSL